LQSPGFSDNKLEVKKPENPATSATNPASILATTKDDCPLSRYEHAG